MKDNYGKVNKKISIIFIKDPKPATAKQAQIKIEKEIKELKEILADFDGYRRYLEEKAHPGRRSLCGNMWELKKQGKCKTIKIKGTPFDEDLKSSSGGLIIEKYCNCGNYSAKSYRGLIDLSCKNCGGKKKSKRIGGW